MYSFYADIPSVCRVSTFGHPRVEACLRLTVAFRSLPRPSSALGARASALCSCSLDFLLILRPFLNRLLCSLLFTSYSRTKSVYLSRKIATRNWPSLPYFTFGFSLSSSLCSCQGACRSLSGFRVPKNPENDTVREAMTVILWHFQVPSPRRSLGFILPLRASSISQVAL